MIVIIIIMLIMFIMFILFYFVLIRLLLHSYPSASIYAIWKEMRAWCLLLCVWAVQLFLGHHSWFAFHFPYFIAPYAKGLCRGQ